ncbi:MAG: cytochrome c nitrite reductase small subunit [Deltaproteobacteria bacterium]|nr:cytochrome c nitrite reductase small subunit [Deltaproteobacteria bacterium]
MNLSCKKVLLYFLVLAAAGGAVGGFLAFGPPGLYAKSETPEFCGSCHVMESRYEAWFHGGAHSRIKCVDCHLPNDTLARHLMWKSIDGLWDAAAFHTGRVPDPITLSSHGARVVQENCQRCHAETVARINEDRKCWDCHRRMSHKQVGAIATWTPSTE